MTGAGFARRGLQGFAFGLGFAVAAGLAWFALRELGGLAGEVAGISTAPVPARPAVPAPVALMAPPAQVRVASHRVERRYGDTVVLGVLHNDGDAVVRSVRVEAAYYDAGGALVDLCGWYVAPALAAGEDKPFKVSCGGTPERPAPESASVKLRIVEAW
ncbi:MAG TPA: FxLYD domain-containing protein [Casimicrobiaceae bacterium]|nr:FxLYD domain-containing protein [Casimicrobiaceae bacterium]